MNLFHTTSWNSFNEIFNSKLIVPKSLSVDDDKNPALKLLRQNDINCIWFSSQRWMSSIFGSYIFEYDADDLLVSEYLVNIGLHNNADTFISTTKTFANWIKYREPSVILKKLVDFMTFNLKKESI